MNFLEQLAFMLTFALIAGFYYPWIAFGFSLGYDIGRVVYGLSYVAGGPNARVPAALTMDVCILGLIGLSLASVSKLIQNN